MVEKKTRQLIVDVEVVDADGAEISEAQFGSGGARRADGTLINQYKNPRPYDGDTADKDREFDGWLRQESEARTQREEAESQAAHDRRVQQTEAVITWILNEVVIPVGRAYWDKRGREDMQRFGRWVASRVSRKSAAESSPIEEATFPVSTSEMSATTIDTPVGIINLDDYRGRHGTTPVSPASDEDATTA